MVGTSSNAGFQCVLQTALTRCVLVPCSCLLVPPVFMAGLGKLRMLPASNKLRMMIEIGVIFASIQGALPAALAVYPQVS